MAIGDILTKSYNAPGMLSGTQFRIAYRKAQEEAAQDQDTVNFSQQTLSRLSERIAKNDSMTASTVSTTLNDGGDNSTNITFNNKTGAITWNGNTLELKGFANALTDDLVVKNANGFIEVYNLNTNQKLTLSENGKRQLVDGKFDQSTLVEDFSVASTLSVGLFINNTGKAATASAGNDIVINRQADAKLNAGLGDDKIFNFAATADTLKGGGGNDAVYSVGLTHGTDIDVSSGDGYVKLMGDMRGGSISLGTGQNYVDAAGRTLTGVSISDASGAEASAVVAKSILGGSNVTLNADMTALDVKQLTSSSVTFGEGVNSMVADKISGTAGDRSTITSTGTNTYQVGTVTFADFKSADAVSDAIKATGNISDSSLELSKGENLLDATGKTLTAVKITSAQGGEGGTTIRAGSIVGRNAQTRSVINLAGSENGNTVDVTGAVKNVNINTGTGAGTVTAGSMNTVDLVMGGSGSGHEQKLTVNGAASALDYTGAAGNDILLIKGAVSNSSLKLGDGDNRVTAQNAKGANQAVSNTDIIATGEGSTTLVMGNYAFGKDGNTISLGAGSNSVTMGSISGSGTTGLTMNLSAGGTNNQTVIINGSINRLNYTGADGKDDVRTTGAVANSTINLGAGNNSFKAQNAKDAYQKVSNTNITATGVGSTIIDMGGYVYGATGNNITLGNGANHINMGGISGSGTAGLSVNLSAGGTNSQTVSVNGSASRLNYTGADGNDDLRTTGAVGNSTINLGAGNNSFTAQNAKEVNQKVSNTNITASGDGSTTITMGDYVYNKVAGNEISLGNGANHITMGSVSGSGTSGLSMDLSGGGSHTQTVIINGSVNRLNYTGADGNDDVSTTGAVANSTINLGAGNNSFTAQNAKDVNQKVSNTNITASGDGSTTITMGGYVYNKVAGNEISLGNGANHINMGGISGSGTSGLTMNMSAGGDHTQTVIINGSVNRLNYTGVDGNDDVSTTGAVANSTINLGAGNNSFTAQNAKDVYQKVSNTNITATGTGSTTLDMGGYVYSAAGNNITLGNGANHINMGGISGSGTSGLTMNMSAGGDHTQTVIINGSVNRLNYTGADGNDNVSTTGAVANSTINLGAGNNSFTAQNAKYKNQKVSNTNITATGTGSTTLEMGNYVYSAAGNNVTLGEGANHITMGTVSGSGTSGLTVNMSAGGTNNQTLIINGSANRLNYMGAEGNDSVRAAGSMANSTVSLGAGDNSLAVDKSVSNTNITSGDGSTNLVMGSYVYSAAGNAIILGNGSNSVTVGNVSGSGNKGLTVDVSAGGTSDQSLNLEGSTNRLTYVGAAGNDSINASGNISNSNIDLGQGENTFSSMWTTSKVTDTSIKAGTDSTNTVTINNLTTTAKGSSSLELGNGNDTVNLVNVSGNTTVNMGGGSSNSFHSANLNGIKLSGSGGGTYTIDKGQYATLDFTGSEDAVRVNIQNSLNQTLINLGNGATYIGSEYEEDKASSAVISKSTINAGAGALTVDAKSISGSLIDMTADGAETASLDLSVNDTMSGTKVDLGPGQSTINANIVSGSVINRTEAGSLTMRAGTVSGTEFNLTGDGSDSISATGDFEAKMTFGGQGADSISVGGAMSGSITTDEDITLTGTKLSGLNATLNGNNTITTNDIENSKLIMGNGVNLISQLPLVEEPEEEGGEQAEQQSGEQEAETPDPNYRLNITGSTIQSGSNLSLNAHNVSSSTVNMVPPEDGQALLEMELTGKMQSSNVNLAGGTGAITVAEMANSNITRTEDGALTLEAGSISGGSIKLGGDGNDRINVSGDMNAYVELGTGEDAVSAGGTISGTVKGDGNVTVTAQKMASLDVTLTGAQNRLDIAESIVNSALKLGDGNTTVGNAGVTYSGTNITAGNGSNTVLGSAYSGGTIAMGNGNNTLDLTESLSATVSLGSGNNIVGTDNTSLNGFKFIGTGSNIIRGRDLIGGSVSMGGEGKTNQLLISGQMQSSAVTLNGGTNTVGGTGLSIDSSRISGGGAGDNTIQANRLNNSTIILGESNDQVDIYGDITDSGIQLGGGLNSLRNTLTEEEAAQNITGQGSALNNKVQNSTILLDGGANVYLGQVSDGSIIAAEAASNINLAALKNSAVDATKMEGGSIAVGTLNGNIAAGVGGSINVNSMESGLIQDDMGQNTITLGTLGERAEVQTGEAIHSTSIHVNTLDGTLNLLNENYAGVKQGNITVAHAAYLGTVKIGGNKVSGAGVVAPEVNTSGFGLGSGNPIV